MFNSILTPVGYISSKRGGSHFIGIIPDSIKTGQDTWVDDLVIRRTYGDADGVQSLYKVRSR